MRSAESRVRVSRIPTALALMAGIVTAVALRAMVAAIPSSALDETVVSVPRAAVVLNREDCASYLSAVRYAVAIFGYGNVVVLVDGSEEDRDSVARAIVESGLQIEIRALRFARAEGFERPSVRRTPMMLIRGPGTTVSFALSPNPQTTRTRIAAGFAVAEPEKWLPSS